MLEKLRHKYYNKLITIRENGNIQSHDQVKSKFHSTINANGGAHTLKHDKIIKGPFNKNNTATVKNK